MTDAIGFVSTLCICVTLAPQIAAIIRTGNIKGLSTWSYALYTIGNAAGLVYGLRIASPPVTLTSVITLATSASVLALILIKRRGERHPCLTPRSYATPLLLASSPRNPLSAGSRKKNCCD